RAINPMLLAIFFSGCQLAQKGSPETAALHGPLARSYHENEHLGYHMTATNQDQFHTLRYAADVSGVVSRNPSGAWAEDFDWSNLIVNGAAVKLASSGAAVHQQVSLAPDYHWSGPDVSKIDPRLVGPVLDLMTFYVDLWLAMHDGKLARVGDHFILPRNTANS